MRTTSSILSALVWALSIGYLVWALLSSHWVRLEICPKSQYERDCRTPITRALPSGEHP